MRREAQRVGEEEALGLEGAGPRWSGPWGLKADRGPKGPWLVGLLSLSPHFLLW